MREADTHAAGGPVLVHRIPGLAHDVLRLWTASRQRARALREIASMDAAMLRDLGLSHHEVVRQMVQRPMDR